MCGIAGQVRGDGRPVARETIEKMCSAMRHRGPDSRGLHLDGPASIAIQRLRVIDLATGDQPIYNEDRSIAVVLNGEIYNFRELRERLTRAGHKFRTEGDTEVIVHLYEDLGDACVKELHGMFAFALWESKRGRLLLARDRVGKKPLLYSQRGGCLSFASEMSALTADPEVPRDVDLNAVDAYLGAGYVPHPDSIFRGVRKLPPGSVLSWEDDRTEVNRYWRLNYGTKPTIGSAPEVHEEIREQLTRAVERRMIADVPLGAFLSGGIDSGAVVAAMARTSAAPVKTFSIGFENAEHSELPRARLIAERYGTDHHEFILKPDALLVLPSVVRHYGEPFADTSAVPSFYVSKIAAEHVTVALNGDGGDESFAGYHRYRAQARASRLDFVPRPLRRLAGRALPTAGGATSMQRARRFAQLVAASPDRRHEQLMSAISFETRAALYSNDFQAATGLPRHAEAIEGSWRAATGPDLTGRLLEVDFNTYLPDDLCAKIDIATMAHSLEARSPFLDHELLEFAASLPSEMKMHGGESKVALRMALRDWLPSEVLDGPKRGFGMPSASDWLRGELRQPVTEILLDPVSLGRGYFSEAALSGLLADHVSRRHDRGQELWTLTMLELWHREFVDGVAAPASL